MQELKKEPHKHKYTKAKYIRLDREQDITNKNFTSMKKPILKLLLCECGHEVGKDLLEQIPERKT